MRDREYDIAFLEIKIRNDELMREWLLHKMGRRAEVLDANLQRSDGRETPETAQNAQHYA